MPTASNHNRPTNRVEKVLGKYNVVINAKNSHMPNPYIRVMYIHEDDRQPLQSDFLDKFTSFLDVEKNNIFQSEVGDIGMHVYPLDKNYDQKSLLCLLNESIRLTADASFEEIYKQYDLIEDSFERLEGKYRKNKDIIGKLSMYDIVASNSEKLEVALSNWTMGCHLYAKTNSKKETLPISYRRQLQIRNFALAKESDPKKIEEIHKEIKIIRDDMIAKTNNIIDKNVEVNHSYQLMESSFSIGIRFKLYFRGAIESFRNLWSRIVNFFTKASAPETSKVDSTQPTTTGDLIPSILKTTSKQPEALMPKKSVLFSTEPVQEITIPKKIPKETPKKKLIQ